MQKRLSCQHSYSWHWKQQYHRNHSFWKGNHHPAFGDFLLKNQLPLHFVGLRYLLCPHSHWHEHKAKWYHEVFIDWIGGSKVMWLQQHVLSHHPYTNQIDLDNDITSADPWLIFHPSSIKITKIYAFQHLFYMFIIKLYAFSSLFNFISCSECNISINSILQHMHLMPET